jgi:hypothetical protein
VHPTTSIKGISMGTARRTSASGLDARARARQLSARYAERETQLQDLAAQFLELKDEHDRKLGELAARMETLGCGIAEIGERVDEPSREIRRLKALAPSSGTRPPRSKGAGPEAPASSPVAPAPPFTEPGQGPRPGEGVAVET